MNASTTLSKYNATPKLFPTTNSKPSLAIELPYEIVEAIVACMPVADIVRLAANCCQFWREVIEDGPRVRERFTELQFDGKVNQISARKNRTKRKVDVLLCPNHRGYRQPHAIRYPQQNGILFKASIDWGTVFAFRHSNREMAFMFAPFDQNVLLHVLYDERNHEGHYGFYDLQTVYNGTRVCSVQITRQKKTWDMMVHEK